MGPLFGSLQLVLLGQRAPLTGGTSVRGSFRRVVPVVCLVFSLHPSVGLGLSAAERKQEESKARKETATYFTINTGAHIPLGGARHLQGRPRRRRRRDRRRRQGLLYPQNSFCSEFHISVLFRVCFAHKLALRACCLSA